MIMKRIPAKYGWESIIFISIFAFMIYSAIIDGEIPAIMISIAALAFLVYVLSSIQYFIDYHFLIIKNSFFQTTKININNIKKIEKTWNLISSPAPSLAGRIEIYWNNQSIVISPKNYEDFKKEMLKINPNIVFKE